MRPSRTENLPLFSRNTVQNSFSVDTYRNVLGRPTMKYRPEVDGLRAVAVLPVILYHAGVARMRGGFVGVDVFFVISGYLITSLLLNDFASNRFSILHFYERRARRILPALFAVLLICIPLAYLWLLPEPAMEFAKSLISALLFFSNIFFARHSGYFDAASTLRPLIHTWSLAVEEQYYLLFPWALLLLWRFARRRMLPILALAALLSLGLSQWAVFRDPQAAYYWLPMRGWEILLGAIVATDEFAAGTRAVRVRMGSIGAFLGLLMIAAAVYWFSEQTPFPGVHALLPTVGAALVIYCASKANLAGKILGCKPLVGIGLVSYSLYLWHQPLLAFARNRSLYDLSPGNSWAILIVSLLLSVLTWRFIERPFRDRTVFNRAQIFRFALVGTGTFLLVGTTEVLAQKYLWTTNRLAFVQKLEGQVSRNYGLNHSCDGAISDSPQCATSNSPEVLLWGDSYAMHLMDGLLASDPHLKIRQATMSDCGPVFDLAPLVAQLGTEWARRCLAANQKVRDVLRKSRSIHYVVLGSIFQQYLLDGARVLTKDETVQNGNLVFSAYFKQTLLEIRNDGLVPIVFSPTPRTGFDVGQCLVKAQYLGKDPSACNFSLQTANQEQKPILDALKQASRIAQVVWLAGGICDADLCRSSENGIFIYRDSGHLSHHGSALLGKRMHWTSFLPSQPQNAPLPRGKNSLHTGLNARVSEPAI